MELITWANTQAVLQEYADAVADTYKQKLEKSGRKATGELLQSISTIVEKDGVSIAVSVNLADYWKYVEWDTRPHLAPIEPLFRWVQAKPLLPRPGSAKMHRNGLPYTQEELQLGIAYAVRHKIAEEGTTGSHDLENTIDELNKAYEERITEAVEMDVNEASDRIFSSFGAWDN